MGELADESIRIVAYDRSWPDRFQEERALLQEAIGEWVVGGIHHIGSTAVPGLDAKPIIDILVGVHDLETSRTCFEQLARLEYLYAPYRAEEMHWFCKPHPSRRAHHLHLVPQGSPLFNEELAFRDRLRSDAGLAEEYAELKHELAARFKHDREAYTDAKADFIRRALDEAGQAMSGQMTPGQAAARAVQVRRAREDDISAIADIHVRSWRAAYRGIVPDEVLDGLSVSEQEENWEQVLAAEGGEWLTLVGEDSDGVLVGFGCAATPSRDALDAKTAEIGALYVDPDHWREGVGGSLLEEALAELLRRDYREAILWVLPENHGAIAFYERFGFRAAADVEKIEPRSGRRVILLRTALAVPGSS
jgi:GrpB-like predicted nucleotidyltransferase (UPF0157 family)/ribosomal protein S18 acetylase RimI-like enzyme